MNSNLFLLIISSAIFLLSVISILNAPNINGLLSYNWGALNCERESDLLDYYKNEYNNPTEEEQTIIDNQKKVLNECKRDKAMYGLEYASLICDVVLGCFCSILSLLHFLEIGVTFKKYTGILVILTGVVGFVLTFVYIIFSVYIFNNDHMETEKLYENGAYLKLIDNKYVFPFTQDDIDKDPNVIYAKYKDLGKKQYNYDSKLYKRFRETESDLYNCRYYSPIGTYPGNLNSYNIIKNYKYSHTGNECQFLWKDSISNPIITSSSNKYLHDRWLTTIILGFVIIICSLILIYLGILLLTEKSEYNNINS